MASSTTPFVSICFGSSGTSQTAVCQVAGDSFRKTVTSSEARSLFGCIFCGMRLRSSSCLLLSCQVFLLCRQAVPILKEPASVLAASPQPAPHRTNDVRLDVPDEHLRMTLRRLPWRPVKTRMILVPGSTTRSLLQESRVLHAAGVRQQQLQQMQSPVPKRQPQRWGQTNDQLVACERKDDRDVKLLQPLKTQHRDSRKIRIVRGHPVASSVK